MSFNLSFPFGSILVTVWLYDIKIIIIVNSYYDKNSSLFLYSKLESFANKGKSVLMPLIKIKKLDGKNENVISSLLIDDIFDKKGKKLCNF